MSDYNFALNMEANDSNPKIIAQIKENSKILEFGPAHGRMTQFLKQEKNCSIDIVEINCDSGIEAAKYADIVCLGALDGDIEKFLWCDKIKGKKYDYIIFADVLEHLYHPESVIERCKDFLLAKGVIIASIPNIAHNAIVANLLNDKFEYQSTGLLDDTHLKFFSYYSFINMIEKTGMKCALIDTVHHEIDETEFNINRDSLSDSTRRVLFAHTSGNIYQYIFCVYKKNEVKIDNRIIPFAQENLTKFYFIKCFWMEEGDFEFTEEKSQIYWIDPRKNEFILEWINSRNVKVLRIDPLNYNAIIKINTMYTMWNNITSVIKTYGVNGLDLGNSVYLFPDNRSQILIEDIEQPFDYVVLGLSYIIFDNKNLMNLEKLFLRNNKQLLEKVHDIQICQMKILKLEQKIESQDTELQERDRGLLKLKEKIESQGMELHERETKLLEVEKENSELIAFKNEILNSRMWKILNVIKKAKEKITKIFAKKK